MSVKICEHRRPERGVIGPRLNAAGRLLKKRFNEVACEEGLFSGQHHIIITLKCNPGMTLSELAKSLNITAATVSVSVKRMEKSGFIEKRPDEKDARTKRLYLTEKGSAVTQNIRDKMDLQESALVKGLSGEEILKLSDLLDRVIENMAKEECPDD